MNVTIEATVDLNIVDQGTVVLFQPLTAEAHRVLTEECATEPWQWMGHQMLVVDHRPAQGLVDFLQTKALNMVFK